MGRTSSAFWIANFRLLRATSSHSDLRSDDALMDSSYRSERWCCVCFPGTDAPVPNHRSTAGPHSSYDLWRVSLMRHRISAGLLGSIGLLGYLSTCFTKQTFTLNRTPGVRDKCNSQSVIFQNEQQRSIPVQQLPSNCNRLGLGRSLSVYSCDDCTVGSLRTVRENLKEVNRLSIDGVALRTEPPPPGL